ncbi:MAG TPA: peptide-methionine (R)-S-oxide reductase MsrB [Patescibacteria group bacterium]|nr:peptide-methionine (R)-S-oxide reductase MsrB [Patescibacteria group bacterium]
MFFWRHSKYKNLFLLLAALFLVGGLLLLSHHQPQTVTQSPTAKQESGEIISGSFDQNNHKTDDEWKQILTQEQYHILREAGTEIPFTGELNNEKRKGTYYSVGCDKPLFRSEQKYDSGTGWPSFWAPIDEKALVLRKESGLGDDRIEVLDTCGGHLGHVFDDGPRTLPDGRKATGKRYCMNSAALYFVPDENN